MKCGDVCLCQFPFTDSSSTKMRPVLVISSDRFNGGQDVVVLPISSKPDPNDSFSVFIEAGSSEFSSSGLRYPSAIKWSKPLTISRVLIKSKLGSLPSPMLDTVRGKLVGLFG